MSPCRDAYSIIDCGPGSFHRQFPMLHYTVVSLIVLRALFCPMLCIGMGDSPQVSLTPDGHGHAGRCGCPSPQNLIPDPSNTSNEEGCPTPSQCPCDESCVCHALPDGANKNHQLSWSLDTNLDAVSVNVAGSSLALTSSLESRTDVRPDLSSGKAVRLVFASLLL